MDDFLILHTFEGITWIHKKNEHGQFAYPPVHLMIPQNVKDYIHRVHPKVIPLVQSGRTVRVFDEKFGVIDAKKIIRIRCIEILAYSEDFCTIIWYGDVKQASKPIIDSHRFPAQSFYKNEENQFVPFEEAVVTPADQNATAMEPVTDNFERHRIAPCIEMRKIQQQQTVPQHNSAGGMREPNRGLSNRTFGAPVLPNNHGGKDLINLNSSSYNNKNATIPEPATVLNATQPGINMQPNDNMNCVRNVYHHRLTNEELRNSITNAGTGRIREPDRGLSNENFETPALPNNQSGNVLTNLDSSFYKYKKAAVLGPATDLNATQPEFSVTDDEPTVRTDNNKNAGMMTEQGGSIPKKVFKVPKLPTYRKGQQKKTSTKTHHEENIREKKIQIEDVDLSTFNGVVIKPLNKEDGYIFYPRRGPQTTTETAAKTTEESETSHETEDPEWTWKLIHEAYESLGYY